MTIGLAAGPSAVAVRGWTTLPDPAFASSFAVARLPSLPDRASRPAKAAEEDRRFETCQALRTLRGVAIVLVLTLHATMPYVAFVKPAPTDFAHPPYAWLAFPIVDARRWLGFDILDAWLDVFLMSLMFFMSGVFTWPSLRRKGSEAFFVARVSRLGAPFLLALFVLMPVTLYPAYRVTGLNPSLTHYIGAYLALPFWPSGPMWFLWVLMALTVLPALLHRFAPEWAAALARSSSGAARAPGRYFLGFATAATLAYVPLALAFSPWDWFNQGPFSFQLSRPLLYAVYYLAGCGVGAHGLGDGWLAAGGRLAQSWRLWFLAALGSLGAWMGLTSLTLAYANGAPPWLQALSDVSYAWAGASSVFFVLAASMRWRARRLPVLDTLSDHGFGIYILHYTPLVWLQYLLLEVHAPALVKAPLVLAGTLGLAYAGTRAFGWVSSRVRTRTALAESAVWPSSSRVRQ